MSGGLFYNFREGNRSELLADYILSSIGITTPVRRQDDYGFDFYCQISDQESGYLTFGFPFVIQLKSDTTGILYGATTADKWKAENLTWLFRNELPFFIGIVNKENISIDIFDTTGLWQVYNQPSPVWSQIELLAKSHPPQEMRNNCCIEKIENWDVNKGDSNKYTVDLGKPLIKITYSDLQNPDILKAKKAVLRSVIALEQINILHRNLGVRAFTEIKINNTNSEGFVYGVSFSSNVESETTNKIYSSLRFSLISLLVNLKAQGKNDEADTVINVLKNICYEPYYEQLFNQNPDVFAWANEMK